MWQAAPPLQPCLAVSADPPAPLVERLLVGALEQAQQALGPEHTFQGSLEIHIINPAKHTHSRTIRGVVHKLASRMDALGGIVVAVAVCVVGMGKYLCMHV